MPRTLRHWIPALLLTALGTAVQAQPYVWDPTFTATALGGGPGTWDTTTANWFNGTTGTDVTWPGGANIALFGGPSGTVTIAPGGVSAGGLTFNSDGYAITGDPLTLTGPGLVTVGPPVTGGFGPTGGQAIFTDTINSVIAGSVGLTKLGSGNLVLTGANSYTGGTTIRGGRVTLDFNAAGAAGTILNPANGLTFGGANAPAGTFAVNGAAAGTTQAVNGMTLSSGTAAIAVTSNGAPANLDVGAITRATGTGLRFNLPDAGSITTTTPNANPAGGQQSILGGYAVVGGATPTWAVSGTGATPGAITGLTTYAPLNTVVAGQDIDINAATTSSASTINSLRLTPGATAYSLTLSTPLTIATGGILLNPAPVAITTITGSTITSGSGELIFNNYTTANGGAAGRVNVASQVTGNINVTINGVGNIGDPTFGEFTYTNSGGQVEFQNAANNFVGTITVLGGRLGNGAPGQAQLGLGPQTNPIVIIGTAIGGGQWFMNSAQTTSRPITLSGFGWAEGGGSFGALRARGTLTGPITLAGNARIGSSNGVTISGQISGPFELSLDGGTSGSATPQTITLSNTGNNWSGGTRIERGNVNMGAVNALPTGTVVTFGTTYGADTLRPEGIAPPTLNINGNATTVAGLAIEAGDTIAGSATVTNTGAAAAFTVNATTNSTFGGIVAGNVVLTKAGPATLTLTNASNTYTAATAVNAGTLALVSAASNNNIATSTAVTVGPAGTLNVTGITAAGGFTVGATQALINNGTVSGAVTAPAGSTVSGTGTYANDVVVSGGTFTPGTATTIGTMASIGGNLSVTSGAVRIKVSGASADRVTSVAGTATFAGNSVLNIVQLGAPTNPSYTILTATGGFTGLTAGPLTTIGRTSYAIDAAALAANSLVLNVTGGPANMRWVGGAATNPTRWENTQIDANWTTTDPVADTTHYYDGDFVTFNNNNNGNFTVNIVGTVSPGSVTVSNGGGTTYTFADGGSGQIAGFTGLTMSSSDGTGTLVLGTQNTFAGPVLVTSGTLSITSPGNLGGGGPANTLTLSGGGGVQATTTFDLGATRPIALGAGGGRLDVTAGSTFTVSGEITGAAADPLTKSGPGTLVLSGANSYAGPTVISAGTLRVASSASLGAVTGGSVTVAPGGVLDLGGIAAANALNFGQKQFLVAGAGDGTTGAITNSVAGVNQQNGLQRVRLTANTTFGGPGRFDIRAPQAAGVNTGQLDLQGFTLTKIGTSQFTLVATDVTDGNIVVNEGVFAIETTSNVPAGTGTITFNNGSTWQMFGLVGNLARPIIVNGAVTVGSANNVVSTASSPVTLNGDLTATALNANGTGTVALTGNISETGGPRSITKIINGTGTTNVLALTGNNTFSGGLNLNAGIVEISTVNNVGTGPLNFNGGTLRFATGSGGADVSVRPVNFNATATIDTNGNNVTFANPIGNGGAGGLTKAGAGTLTLAVANTYTGPTAVTGGTLLVTNASGSATGTGRVDVTGTGAAFSGGTLGGGNPAGTVGFIAGDVAISSTVAAQQGGTLAPGTSVGTLTTTGGNMSWNPVGAYVFEHDASATSPAPVGGTSDLVRGTGTAVLDLSPLGSGAGQQFNLVLSPTNFPAALPTSPVVYTIADFSASTNPAPITPPVGIVGTDLSPFFNITGGFQGTPTVALVNGNLVQVTFTPVPEADLVLLACGAAAAGLAWRRRRAAPACAVLSEPPREPSDKSMRLQWRSLRMAASSPSTVWESRLFWGILSPPRALGRRDHVPALRPPGPAGGQSDHDAPPAHRLLGIGPRV